MDGPVSMDTFMFGLTHGSQGYIANKGNKDCYVDFDNSIDTDNSYLLESGESITIDFAFIRLYFKAVKDTTELYIMKIIQ